MKTPGQRIKDERTEKGWSQQKLADEISRIKKGKISRAAVAQWESGDSKSQKPENFFAAAEALGLVVKWVLDGIGEKYIRYPNKPEIINLTLETPESTYRNPKITEIVKLAEKMSEKGIERLLETAEMLSTKYPKEVIEKLAS